MLGKLYLIIAFLKEYSREYLFQGMLQVFCEERWRC